MVIHNVFFYLRSDLSVAERHAFATEGLLSLGKIATVQSLVVGQPAAVTARPVVEAGYTYALVVHFADVAGHDAYQVDPLHLAFLTRFKGYWTKVQIYDVQDVQAAAS